MKLNKKGFTLIELLAVIAILALLVVMVMPRITKILRKADAGTYEVEANKIVKAAENFYVANANIHPEYFKGTNVFDKLKYKGIKPDEITVKINGAGKSYVYARYGTDIYIKNYTDKVATRHSTENLSKIFSFEYNITDYLTSFTIIPAKGNDNSNAKLFERMGGGFIQVGGNNDFFQYDDLIGGNWVYWVASKSSNLYWNMNAQINGQTIDLYQKTYVMSRQESNTEGDLSSAVLDCEFSDPSSCKDIFEKTNDLGKGRIIYFAAGAVLVAEDQKAVESIKSLGANIDHTGSYYLNLNTVINSVNDLCSVYFRWDYTNEDINLELDRLPGYINCGA